MKIVSIVGARPQFIKAAPLSRKLRQKYTEILVHTGQHYDPNMSDIFFSELNIPKPDYNLGIGSGSHGEQTGKMLVEIEKVIIKEEPDIVIVYGDTNSTLAGSLAASKLHIPVAHVEAGLRSFDKSMPEEINRILTDKVSDFLFCPTETAVKNLENEGIRGGVYNVGDVMMDAVLYNSEIAEDRSNILDDLGVDSGEYLLATVHRASNTDSEENLRSIIKAFLDSGENVLFPVHPRTKKYMNQYGLWKKANENLIFIDPIGYLDMLKLVANAKKILTDSGGLQKEAYILGVPCITLRDNTEWVETVDAGWNMLAGSDCSKIINLIKNFNPIQAPVPIFGDGNACDYVYEKIYSNFNSYI